MQWEIGQLGFGDRWYTLGTTEAWNPMGALKACARQRRGIQPGIYGVRARGLVDWQRFRVDEAGAVHSEQTDESTQGAA